MEGAPSCSFTGGTSVAAPLKIRGEKSGEKREKNQKFKREKKKGGGGGTRKSGGKKGEKKLSQNIQAGSQNIKTFRLKAKTFRLRAKTCRLKTTNATSSTINELTLGEREMNFLPVTMQIALGNNVVTRERVW
jgi:hypothetical protein